MTESILINVNEHEHRVAFMRDNKLHDLDIDQGVIKCKSNIYKARVTRVEPSLEAAFVEFGASRQGFLPIKEIAEEYFQTETDPIDRKTKVSIKNLIKEGQELIVQVDKEERGTKGAALTTYISLAGCYLVLMPNNANGGGISRRINGNARDNLRELIDKLNIPDEMSIIVRTAGIARSFEELQWDFDILKHQWKAIRNAAKSKPAPFLIHQEGDIIIRSIRDNLKKEIDEILIDEQSAFVKAKNYLQQIKPELISKLKFYQDKIPLFVRYQTEHQIETACLREVALPSGGSIVIDPTEALVSIDINSAKATSGADIETTALNTNLEAAREIARQLRIRNLGGLIVIDFIDMHQQDNHRLVQQCLKEALQEDRARLRVGAISQFGLLEMSRQRLRLSLGEDIQQICPTCEGRGVLRSIFSLSNTVLRLIEEEAVKTNIAEIHAHLPLNMATFIINEKRDQILAIEKSYFTKILIIPNQWQNFPDYHIECIQHNASKDPLKLGQHSFELMKLPEPQSVPKQASIKRHTATPAVTNATEIPFKSKKNDSSDQSDSTSFLKRIWNNLFGNTVDEGARLRTSKTSHRRYGRGGPNRNHHPSNRRNKNNYYRKQSANRQRHRHRQDNNASQRSEQEI